VSAAAESKVSVDAAVDAHQGRLGGARLSVVPEAAWTGWDASPAAVEPPWLWVQEMAAGHRRGRRYRPPKLNGTVKALGEPRRGGGQAAGDQGHSADVRAADARDAYREAVARILEATRDGALLRGEVQARCQHFGTPASS
jgi:hypothetical protein